MTSLPIVLDTTIRIKIISRRQKRRPGISSLMKRELESLGLRGVAFPEGEGEGGSVYLSNGSSGLRKEDGEHVQRRRKTRKEEKELEGRNPINLFIKRFSCLCRGRGRGLSRSHGKYEALKRESVAESSAGGNRHDSDRIPKDQRR